MHKKKTIPKYLDCHHLLIQQCQKQDNNLLMANEV